MDSDLEDKETALKAATSLAECAGFFFDRAPVMMHMIDGGGRLSRVNRRWTEALGYSSEQVIGRFAPDFLTAESRDRAINETLPLYWRVGSVRSVRYRFVKKDGGVTDLQLDAELVAVAGANRLSYAAIRNIDDRTQWEQSSDTLATLVGLTKLQRKYQEVVFPAASIQLQKPARLPDASTRYSPRPTPAGDVLLALLEIAGDISGSLKALVGLYNDSTDAIVEQQQEILIVMKGIQRNLDDLADATTA